MSGEEALLQAIHDSPDDDLLRLVHADWLDDHDQPGRAELVRVQVELARLEEHDPRRLCRLGIGSNWLGKDGPRLLRERFGPRVVF